MRRRLGRALAVLCAAASLTLVGAPSSLALELPTDGLVDRSALDWLLEPACHDLKTIEAVNDANPDLEIGDNGVRVAVFSAEPTCQDVQYRVDVRYSDGTVSQKSALGGQNAAGFRMTFPATTQPACVSATATLAVAGIPTLQLDRIPDTGCISVEPGTAEPGPDDACADIIDGSYTDDPAAGTSGVVVVLDEPGCPDAVLLTRFVHGDPAFGSTLRVRQAHDEPLPPGEPVEDVTDGSLDYVAGFDYATPDATEIVGFTSTARPHGLGGGETYYEVLDDAVDGGVVGTVRSPDECPIDGGCGGVRFK